MALRITEEAGLTNVGQQRSTNEDAFLEAAPLFAVADGMGGARAGEVASNIAVEMLASESPAAEAPEERLAEVARAANRRIYELAQEDESRSGMGTTLTAVIVSGGDVAVGHVGDSRLYRLRDDRLERLTRDHSLVEELVRRGELDPGEVESHPQRSIITRALGPAPEVDVETFSSPGRAGDVYLLCSDGLTSMVSEDRVGEILRGGESLRDAAERLVNAANNEGGRDNITVVLFRLGEDGDPEADEDTLSGRDTGGDLRVEDVQAAARAQAAETTVGARPPARPAGPGRRRLAAAAAVVVLAVAALTAAFWFVNSQYYFLGANAEGLVTAYRGLPWDLPFGVSLYREVAVGTVRAAEVPAGAQRTAVLDHRRRSREDAIGLLCHHEESRGEPPVPAFCREAGAPAGPTAPARPPDGDVGQGPGGADQPQGGESGESGNQASGQGDR